MGQSKNVPYIKTKLEHQTNAWLTWISREGGRGKVAKTEPPGRASVATEPESLFCFCAPAKLATEASELQGQLCMVLWMLVWDPTVLEYSLTFACARVLPISKPGVILCGVRGSRQRWGLSLRLGSVVIWLCAWVTWSVYHQYICCTERQWSTGYSSGLLLTSQCPGLPPSKKCAFR